MFGSGLRVHVDGFRVSDLGFRAVRAKVSDLGLWVMILDVGYYRKTPRCYTHSST